MIKNKIEEAFKSWLKIIFCFGETLAEKNKKKTKRVIKNQIQRAITNKKFLKKILFAYEPVWSIGTGLIPKSKELFETINFIKKRMKNYKVLYGGSVNPKNISQLKSINNIDGYLIGGASQKQNYFIDIIKKTIN